MRRIHLLLAVCLLLGGAVAFSGEKIKGNFDEITLSGTKITSWDNVSGSGVAAYDNLTGKPTINGVDVTGAVLDNGANYPTLNQNTTGTAANVTGIVAVANGGTGSDNATGARANLGLVIGTNVLAPDGSAASLTDFPTLNQDTTGTAVNITGVLDFANGGFGESVATKIGVPYFDNGTVTWDSLVEFLARIGVTYNPATGMWTFSGELASPQFNSTADDGEHYFNAANSTAPTDNVSVGDCYFDNTTTSNTLLCYNGTAWVEPTVHTKDFVIYGYSASHDNVVRWKADSIQTLTQLDCITGGTDNVTVTLYECDANAANCSTTG